MAPSEFLCFLSLPFEIRREIYWLATPPRIVNIKEKTAVEYDEFEETLSTHPVQLRIHPDIQFFRANWADEIRRRIGDGSHFRQTALEEHGFTGSKPIQQPWTPSAQCPEIPPSWLANEPELAWEIVREGYLYSKAPIPPLLHTCAESRSILTRGGYRLAFETRTAGPRTWFHFDRDTLFLSDVPLKDERRPDLLSGGPWDVGQFAPADLRRVRRLALEGSADALSDADRMPMWESGVSATTSLCISLLLKLLGSVEELWFVEWTRTEVEGWRVFEPCFLSSSLRWDLPLPPVVPGSVIYVARKSGDFVVENVELADMAGLGCLVEAEWGNTCKVLRSGFGALHLVNFMENHRESGAGIGTESGAVSYSGYMGRVQREFLEQQRARMVAGGEDFEETRTSDGTTAGYWKIPEAKLVHVLPRNMIDYLYEERRSIAAGLRELQMEWAHLTKQERCSVAVSGEALPIYERRRAFEDKHWPPNFCLHEDCQGTCQYRNMEDRIKKWWVKHGPSL
ncbi:hypothetical protein BDP55DRAFT_652950 [Colletotrichum godetiae]|uniref:2EXR domain-containing protein n=1 Tax=Colletotrichum godetiae TaxID=1209918 RepID=A0AAJ0AS26_9PEZI|nr:uncharacterized protein BDP55DRAFT_652950 [Colletotrichum godetiae]KAK1689346.1 hypothetical protein BDP55DRAFT_652950 [Colletotrichum godetiae]